MILSNAVWRWWHELGYGRLDKHESGPNYLYITMRYGKEARRVYMCKVTDDYVLFDQLNPPDHQKISASDPKFFNKLFKNFEKIQKLYRRIDPHHNPTIIRK